MKGTNSSEGKSILAGNPGECVPVLRHPLVLISSRIQDHQSLRSIVRDSPWELQGAPTGRAGLDLIRRNRAGIPVVICEHSIPDGGWRILLTELSKLEVGPSLIVSSPLADERLWAEVLNLGAFDLLLGAPFDADEVLRVTQSAWRAWNTASRPGGVPRIAAELFRGRNHTPPRTLTAGSHG